MARIFIVEGEDHAADALSLSLRAAGHEVVGTAISTFEAYDRVARTCPDLAVVDVRSRSGGDHVELALGLRKRFELLTVFVSGNAEVATLRRIGRVDPAGFLAQPFDDRQLRAAVELGLSRRSHELARHGEEDRATVSHELQLLAALSRPLVGALDAARSPAEKRALVLELDSLGRAREARPVPLHRVAGRAIESMRERLGHRAMFELAAEADLWVAGDEAQLARAIGHLAAVALQAHGAGAGTWVRVVIGRAESGLAELEVAVSSETGAPTRPAGIPGLSAAVALGVAEAIVTAHGGAVRHEREGERVVARVTLPTVAADEGVRPLRLARELVSAAG